MQHACSWHEMDEQRKDSVRRTLGCLLLLERGFSSLDMDLLTVQ
jgi:hypothetical protein